MKRILLISLGLLSAVAFAADPVPRPRVIVMFGDSTTAEPPGFVNKSYSRRVEEALRQEGFAVSIRNAGVPGNTTTDARARFERDVLAHQPYFVVIQFGVNDSAVDVWKTPPATLPRVPLPEFEANLRWFIAELQKRNARPILMTADPTRWTASWKNAFGKPPYHPDEVDGFDTPVLGPFNSTVRRVAKELKLPLVEAHDVLATKNLDALMPDGMHPNDDGHQIIADLLVPVLRTQLAARLLEDDRVR